MSTKTTEKVIQLINEAESVCALTGAGISTNAGIPDFRGPKGLYVTRQYDPEKVFDINYFLKDPVPFFDFARDFVGLELTIKPTIAHTFLSKLEDSGKLKGIVTQNIDSLHQMSGSQNVLEMHGSFWRSHCLECSHDFSFEDLKGKLLAEKIPCCHCSGIIKPDIVFFGENVKCLTQSTALMEKSDLLLVMGTSCVVYPAAMLPGLVEGKIVVMNMTEVELNLDNVVLSVTEEIDDFCGEVMREMNFS